MWPLIWGIMPPRRPIIAGRWMPVAKWGIAKAKRPISRIEVTSFDEAKPLEAERAFYVEGSDVHPCARPVGSAPVTDERGCCLKPVYDRCEPSLVAFADEASASSFAVRSTTAMPWSLRISRSSRAV